MHVTSDRLFTCNGTSDRLFTCNGTIAGNHSYGLDKLDNATCFAGVTGTYNGLNQIATFNAVSYTYDANGNMSSDGTRTYTFDAPDRLKTDTQDATTVTFASDGIGRRLKQTVGATETRYLSCSTTICQLRNGSDTTQKRFYSESEYVHTGTKKYLTLTDHLGSVRDVIDITGTPRLVGSFDYRPYGAVARSWGTVTTGHTHAGLFLSTTRAYNPANGKWLNRDPIRETAGPNGYSYVNAMPTMGADPTGLIINWIGDGTPEHVGAYLDAIEYLRRSPVMAKILDYLEKSDVVITINYFDQVHEKGGAYGGGRILWNPKSALLCSNIIDHQTPAM
jgi:RHS repeat-associated protein